MMCAKKRKSSSMEGVVIARDVVAEYGPVVALNGFTAEFPEGIVGLLGPNGAGKSTFIKVALGLMTPSQGDVNIRTRGRELKADNIGYMPETDCLPEDMNAVEVVEFFSRLSGLGRKDARQRAHQALDFVGIGEERYRLVGGYSTGMKQKVKLAQAIAHDPDVLFLDEPTNGLDPMGRNEMLHLIRSLRRPGRCIIVSSHVLPEVQQIADYIVIISNGRCVSHGSLAEMLSHPTETKVILRGDIRRIKNAVKALQKRLKIERKEFGDIEATVVIASTPQSVSNEVFSIAHEHGVQVRYFGPEQLSLEAVFFSAVEGGR